MRILILGDCHGRLDLVHRACLEARERWGIEAAIQVGDFGFYPQTLKQFLHEGPRRFPVPVYAIDGNHERHDYLMIARQQSAAAWTQANLIAPARGTTLIIGGMRFGFLGGALHADRSQSWSDGTSTVPRQGRPRPPDPFAANWVTAGDVARAVGAFTASPPEALVTHSCPAGIGIGMEGDPRLAGHVDVFIRQAGFRCGPVGDRGEPGLTTLWRQLPTRPRWWLFGHFHRRHEQVINATRFVCVGSTDATDGVDGVRPVLFDTASRSLDMIDDIVLARDLGKRRR